MGRFCKTPDYVRWQRMSLLSIPARFIKLKFQIPINYTHCFFFNSGCEPWQKKRLGNTFLKAWLPSKNEAALKVENGVSLIYHYPVNALPPLLVLNSLIITGFCPEVSMAARALPATTYTDLVCMFSYISPHMTLLILWDNFIQWTTGICHTRSNYSRWNCSMSLVIYNSIVLERVHS